MRNILLPLYKKYTAIVKYRHIIFAAKICCVIGLAIVMLRYGLHPLENKISRMGGHATEYNIHSSAEKHGYQGNNPQHKLVAVYHAGNISVSHASATAKKWTAKFSVQGIYANNRKIAKVNANAKAFIDGNTIIFKHNAFTEQYINNADGIRQNFIIDRPISNDESFSIKIKATGATLNDTENSDGTYFYADNEKYTYNNLKAWDANGTPLDAKMYAENGNIELLVHVAKASYPITVDPLISVADNILESNQTNAQLGYSVAAAGDINGDGFADAISGAPFYANGQNNEGAVFVYYGSATGIPATPSLVLEANQADANFGYSVAGAIDINKDGYSDIIVGAPYYDDGQTDEGAVFIYYGSSSGLQTTPTILQNNMSEALFGFSVSGAGDVNNDGYGDIVVGSNWYTNGHYKEGAIYLFKGSASGIVSTPLNVIESNQSSALLGYSVAGAGDVNGDGYDDVIAGAWLYDDGETDEGAAFIYYGSSSGLNAANATLLQSNQMGAGFGYSVAGAGDVNGDGYADVIVGSWLYDNGQTDEGAAFVYHGSATGLNTTYATLLEANQAGAYFGASVNHLGDINKDGYADVIVGTFKFSNGQTDEGAAFVYYGSATGISTTSIAQAESNQAGAQMAFSVVGVGDINGDGYPDVLVGAPAYANGQTKEGAVFAYYNITGEVPQKIYVNATASGSNNGSSWANAFTDLESALAQANSGTGNYNVYVAAGTYKPTNTQGSGQQRQATFAIKRAGINLYGGYNAATGSRNIKTNITTISGDMNSYKLMNLINVAGINNATEKITIDGFTIRDSYAELEDADDFAPLTINGVQMPVGKGGAINIASVQAKVEINNCILRNNWTIEGGAIYSYSASEVLLRNTQILYNAAWNSGGGIASLQNSNFTVLNCVISGNAAFLGYGGGWYLQKSSAKIYGVLFHSNTMEDDGLGDSSYTNRGGGAIYADNSNLDMSNVTLHYNMSSIHPGAGLHATNNSTATISNAIFYNNLSNAERDIYQNNSSVTVSNSMVQSGFAGGINIFVSAPMFVNAANPAGIDGIYGTADDGLRITSPCSPAINGGDNAKVPAMLKTDLVGTPRVQYTTVDIGAYESTSQPTVIKALYVNAAIPNSGDGTSWSTAFKTLKEALDVANAGCSDSIKVAAGTYYPTGLPSVNDRDASFNFTRDRLKVIGGYNAVTGQRNFRANQTILSGDLLTSADSDNSYHVIKITNITGPDSLIIDGFTITKANANGDGDNRNQGGGIYAANLNTTGLNIFVRNCTFAYNKADYGAGVATHYSSVPAFVNCTFYQNVANYNGGAFHNATTSGPSIINCVFVGNSAINGGAILNSQNSSPRINACTFYGNTASGQGGVMYNTASWSVFLNSSIVWGNSSVIENANYSSVDVSNNIIQDGYGGSLNANPLFVNVASPAGADGIFGTTDDGLMLQQGSPAINLGSNSGLATDIAGNVRIQKGAADMGAYESPYEPLPTPDVNGVLYVSETGNGNHLGNSWANAFPGFSTALAFANSNTVIKEIRVAAGTYYPTGVQNGTDRTASFVIKRNNLKLMGAYNATTGTRDLTANATVLSGDIGTADNSADNSFHVMAIVNVPNTVATDSIVVDGFTVTKGNANIMSMNNINGISIQQRLGGGILMQQVNANTSIRNCTIIQNNSLFNGGGLFFWSATATVQNCTIQGNNSKYGGGANISQSANVKFKKCRFYSNSAEQGGGLFNAQQINIADCIFNGNTASISGAGSQNSLASAAYINCLFTGNTVTTLGAAIYNYEANISLTNCTLQGNRAYSGGGIYSESNSSTTVNNSIVWGNIVNSGQASISNSSGSVSTVNFSIVQGADGRWNGFNFDPDFVDAANPAGADGILGTADDGLRLQPNSFAIARGDKSYYEGLNANTKDVAGNPRVYNFAANGNIDMGAYEYQGLLTTTLTNFENINKTYGDANFDLTEPNSNSDGDFSYTSSDASVATVTGKTVSITGAGTVTLTATQEATGDYSSATISLTLTVGKATPTLSGFADISKTYGSGNFILTAPNSNSNGTFSYISSNENVATISGNMVTIKGAGTATITATQEATANYNSQSINLTFAIEKANQTINFNVLDAKTTSNPDFVLTANASSGLEIKYTSTDNNVASVYQDAGVWKVKIKGAGTTYITALQEGNINYNSTSVSQMLLITEPVLPVTLVNYTAKKENNFVKLDWQIATENNNKGFEIYRSGDDSKFVKIGEVSASHISHLISHIYSFTDKNPLNGNNYYQLVQVDNDGKKNDLGVRIVTFNFQLSTFNLYPNPTTDKLTITFEQGKYSKLELTNLNGQLLQRQTISANETRVNIDLSVYPKGTYLLRLLGTATVRTEKVLKM